MLTETEFIQGMNKMQEDLERLQIPEEVFINAAKYIINHLTIPAFLEEKVERTYRGFLRRLKKQPPVKKKALLLTCVIFAHAAAKGLYILLSEKVSEEEEKQIAVWETFSFGDRTVYDLLEYVIEITDEDTVTLVNELLGAIDDTRRRKKTDDLRDPKFKLEIICYMAIAGPLLAEKFAGRIKTLTNQ